MKLFTILNLPLFNKGHVLEAGGGRGWNRTPEVEKVTQQSILFGTGKSVEIFWKKFKNKVIPGEKRKLRENY